jgi:hypothetical protein
MQPRAQIDSLDTQPAPVGARMHHLNDSPVDLPVRSGTPSRARTRSDEVLEVSGPHGQKRDQTAAPKDASSRPTLGTGKGISASRHARRISQHIVHRDRSAERLSTTRIDPGSSPAVPSASSSTRSRKSKLERSLNLADPMARG